MTFPEKIFAVCCCCNMPFDVECLTLDDEDDLYCDNCLEIIGNTNNVIDCGGDEDVN